MPTTLTPARFYHPAVSRALFAVLAITLSACATVTGRAPQSTGKAPAPATSGLPGQTAVPAGHPPVAQAPAMHLPDVDLTPDLLYDMVLGEIARQRGQPGVAAEALARAALASRDPRLAEHATRVAVEAKRADVALRTAALWSETSPEQAAAWEARASLEMSLGQVDEARVHFGRALSLESSDLTRGYARIADILSVHKDRDVAVSIMNALIALHPESAEAQMGGARLAARVNRADDALAAVDRALALRPDWEDAAIFKLRLLIAVKKFDQVDAWVDAFTNAHPKAKHFQEAAARSLLDRGENEKAREQFRRIAQAFPDDPDALFASGMLAADARDYAEANRFLRQALKVSPNNDQVRLQLGQVAAESKKYDEAVEWFESVTDSTLGFEARLRAALAVASKGDVESARLRLRALDPADERQHVQIVLTDEQILREAGRLKEAMEVMNSAVDAAPDNTQLLYARGLLAAQLNMLDLHEHDIRKVIAKEPRNAHALNALGYTLADQTNRLAEAQKLVAEALSIKPGDPFILDSMGWVQFRLGNLQKAAEYLRHAFKLRDDPEIAAHLGEVLWGMGERNEARDIWKRALKEAPSNQVLRETMTRLNP